METYGEDRGMQQQWNSSENTGVDKTKTLKQTVDAFMNEKEKIKINTH